MGFVEFVGWCALIYIFLMLVFYEPVLALVFLLLFMLMGFIMLPLIALGVLYTGDNED